MVRMPPKKSRYARPGGVVDELVFGARDYERLAVVMEDCRKQVFLAGEQDFVGIHG